MARTVDRVSHALSLVGSAVGGKYTLQRVLGRGGMGVVYEAVHGYTKRRVAVKLFGPECATSPGAVARFLQEAQAPSSIGHPNIVEVLDAGEDPQHGPYLVLELLDGEDMEAAVERGHLDLAALLDVTIQLLDALGSAHARGFVHRDIKPANVFLLRGRDGALRVKLLDFGIVRHVSRGITVGHAVMGTPHYMSPEQAKGLPADARSDLWSVGAMLFHALAGVPPYDGANPNVIMVNVLLQDEPSLAALRPDLSKGLVHAVERALSKSPDDRWADAAAMAAQLAAAPERRDSAAKITRTLRSVSGGVSELRLRGLDATADASEPPARTGTLGDDDPPRTPVAVPVAVPVTRSRRRAAAVVALTAAATALALVGVASTRTRPSSTPRRRRGRTRRFRPPRPRRAA